MAFSPAEPLIFYLFFAFFPLAIEPSLTFVSKHEPCTFISTLCPHSTRFVAHILVYTIFNKHACMLGVPGSLFFAIVILSPHTLVTDMEEV
jgi:hypothetical protein